ncbi:acyl-CoA thioester hydrolase [Spinellus fusiger]|nr:acyl-CoA thioester hydrolase [Spinellus fusiger]
MLALFRSPSVSTVFKNVALSPYQYSPARLRFFTSIAAIREELNAKKTEKDMFWIEDIIKRENKKPLEPPCNSKERTLIEKKMSDSYVEKYLLFKSSPELLEEYIFVDKRIRVGKLLEDLDALAGTIAYKHVDNGDPEASPTTIVTASVDRLDLMISDSVENYKLSGHVSYVGNSSMEIFIKAETVDTVEESDSDTLLPKKPEDISLLGSNTVLATRITMVALDSYTRKPIQVNPIVFQSPEEERIFEFAKANKKRKKRAAEYELTRRPPTPEERLTIHDIYLQSSQYTDDFSEGKSSLCVSDAKPPLPKNLVWMSDTHMESNLIMHSQYRNIHNSIFGGYLMRKAYELAYSEAALFTNTMSNNLLAMDQVIFRKPVNIGTFLNLKACVVHAEGYPHRSLQIRVVAQVTDIENGTQDISNIFYFTLICSDDNIKVKRVLPKTYAETMLWLAGHRRRMQGIKARQLLLNEVIDQYHGILRH